MSLEPRFLRLADRFLDFIQKQTGFASIVCDETGTIVRATVRTRIGNPHSGAARILRNEVDEAAVTAEEAAANPLVKEGLSCPIVVGGARVGTFGISGPLVTTRPLARLASVVLATWLKELEQKAIVHQAASGVLDGVENLAAWFSRSAESARRTAESISAASGEAIDRVQRAEAVVSTVQRIAQQSRILSINGSVEATRAGDHGRAFAVVAKDMTRLAEETKATSNSIQKTLGEIGRSIVRLEEAVTRFTNATIDQGATLDRVKGTATALKAAISGLESGFGLDAPGAAQGRGRQK